MSKKDIATGDYRFQNSEPAHTHSYLWAPTSAELKARNVKTIFELGCGNGAYSRRLISEQFDVSGCDPSEEGIKIAKETSPEIKLELGSCYDDLSSRYGQFDAVVSLEVVEHVYAPEKFAQCAFSLLKERGVLVLSTPYHGYLKNLAMAVTGKLDRHFTALWEHGHIKFWSPRTISILLEKEGFRVVKVHRVGRVPSLAKSMIVVATKSEGHTNAPL